MTSVHLRIGRAALIHRRGRPTGSCTRTGTNSVDLTGLPAPARRRRRASEARRGRGAGPDGVLAYRSTYFLAPSLHAPGVDRPPRSGASLGPFSTRRSLQLVRHVIDRGSPPALDRPSAGRLRTVVPRHAPSPRDAASGACAAGPRDPAVGGRAGAGPSWDLPAGRRLARRRGRAHRQLTTSRQRRSGPVRHVRRMRGTGLSRLRPSGVPLVHDATNARTPPVELAGICEACRCRVCHRVRGASDECRDPADQ